MKQTICPSCGGSLESLAIGWRCKKSKGFISYQDGKFYEYVEKPFMPPQTNADRIRAMSDEEWVDFLTEEKWKCDNYRVCKECPRYIGDCCLPLDEWLKQPKEDA